jgi:uncharacterized NAD(P)/FAD-binding protein YdhS
MGFTFAVLGAGLTGTSFLLQLAHRLRRAVRGGAAVPAGVRIDVFERHARFGPGLPHNPDYVLPFHITNMCAHDMTVRADVPDDLQRWVDANRLAVAERNPQLLPYFWEAERTTRGCHYPRAVMGQYLEAQFFEAVRIAGEIGARVILHPRTEVIDLIEEQAGLRIVARRSRDREPISCVADRALLATGHWFAQPTDARLFTSPWPAQVLLHEIPPGAEVGVIGSSLSAIETVLTLTSTGRFFRDADGGLDFAPAPPQGHITLYSRNGMLPRVRGRIGARPNRVLTRDALRALAAAQPDQLRLERIHTLLDAELRAAYGNAFDWREVIAPRGSAEQNLRRYLAEAAAGDGPQGALVWQTVLAELLPHARMLYLALAASERARFDRDFTTAFFMHAATQPAINAEKLYALLRRGIVSVRKLDRGYRLEKRERSREFVFDYLDDAGGKQRAHHAFVVDARGQPTAYSNNPSPLARGLIRSGIVELTNGGSGGVLIDPATHSVRHAGASGVEGNSNRLYAVGAMTRNQIIDASMARGLVLSTARIAEDIAGSVLARA